MRTIVSDQCDAQRALRLGRPIPRRAVHLRRPTYRMAPSERFRSPCEQASHRILILNRRIPREKRNDTGEGRTSDWLDAIFVAQRLKIGRR